MDAAARRPVGDVVLVAALVILGQLEAWSLDDPDSPRLVLAVVAVAMPLPLLARRRRPLAALAVLSALGAVWWIAVGDGGAAMFPVIALGVGAYALAAYRDWQTALLGLGAALLPVLAAQLVVGNGIGPFVLVAVIMGIGWVTGRVVRRPADPDDPLTPWAATG